MVRDHAFMRGQPPQQTSITTFVSIEQMVEAVLPKDHPLRVIRSFTDDILRAMSADIDTLYSSRGRPSIAPELLLRAMLWQALFSVRSERLLMDVLQFDVRCRWFVGLPLDHNAWDSSTFSFNRQQLRLELMAEAFFLQMVKFLRDRGLVSSEHLSVDASLIEAWASHKSAVEKSKLDDDGKPPPAPPGGRNGWTSFKGKGRSNKTHVSTSDPDARLAHKNGSSEWCHMLSVAMENRHGFAVNARVVPAMSTAAEKDAALKMVDQLIAQGHTPKTVGGDRAYGDGDDFVMALLERGIAPHVPPRADRPNALANLLVDLDGFKVSQKARMFIETIFGWAKSVGGFRQTRTRGQLHVQGSAYLVLSANNLRRYAGLMA